MATAIRKDLLGVFYNYFTKLIEKYNSIESKTPNILFDIVSSYYESFRIKELLFLTKSDLFYILKYFYNDDSNDTVHLNKIKSKRNNLIKNLQFAYKANNIKSNRIIVKNLPIKVTAEHLKVFCDNVKNVYINKEKYTNTNFNVAVLEFYTIEDAENALRILHFKEVLGYLLVVYYIKPITEDEAYYQDMHYISENVVDLLGIE